MKKGKDKTLIEEIKKLRGTQQRKKIWIRIGTKWSGEYYATQKHWWQFGVTLVE